jgi:hypothetical protein
VKKKTSRKKKKEERRRRRKKEEDEEERKKKAYRGLGADQFNIDRGRVSGQNTVLSTDFF